MDFYKVLDQVIDLLRQRGRITYRALKIQFNFPPIRAGITIRFEK